jgi:hypothetical protein
MASQNFLNAGEGSDATAWAQRCGTHAELLLAFRGSIGFIPGACTAGMNQKSPRGWIAFLSGRKGI